MFNSNSELIRLLNSEHRFEFFDKFPIVSSHLILEVQFEQINRFTGQLADQVVIEIKMATILIVLPTNKLFNFDCTIVSLPTHLCFFVIVLNGYHLADYYLFCRRHTENYSNTHLSFDDV